MKQTSFVEKDLNFAILGLLNHESMTGYDLKKFLGIQLGSFWGKSSYGKIYRVLEQLEKEELLQGSSIESEKKKRTTVKLYKITEHGRTALSKWIQTPIETEISLDKYTIKLPDESEISFEFGNLIAYLSYFLLKFYFGANASIETNLTQIDNFEINFVLKIRQVLEVVLNQLEQLAKDDQDKIDHHYYLLTAKFGLQMCEAFSEWKLFTKQHLENIGQRGTKDE